MKNKLVDLNNHLFEELENEIQDLNICRTKRNIDLQKYIMLQVERRENAKTSTKKKI